MTYLGVCKYNLQKPSDRSEFPMIIMPLTCGYRNKCDLRHTGLHRVLHVRYVRFVVGDHVPAAKVAAGVRIDVF